MRIFNENQNYSKRGAPYVVSFGFNEICAIENCLVMASAVKEWAAEWASNWVSGRVSERAKMMWTDFVISPSPALPREAEMLCLTILGEHDALKDDNQSPAKVMPLSSQTPTFDARRCRPNTFTWPPLGSWNAVFYNTWWTWCSEKW